MLLTVLLALSSAFLSVNGDDFRVVCYIMNWSHWRTGQAKFTPSLVDTTRCTHTVYSSAELDTEGLHIIPHDSGDPDMYSQLSVLKSQNPNLKNLLSVGGWGLGVEEFDAMVASQSNIDMFAANAIQYLRQNNFDGLNLDWEYPGDRGSLPEDKQKYTQLLTTLKNAFVKDATDTGSARLLLTALVSANPWRIQTSYDLPALAKILDFFDLATFGIHGTWESQTGHPSALYSPTGGQDSVDQWVQYVLNSVSAPLLNLGIPTSGVSYNLSDPTSTAVASAASGSGAAGSLLKQEGVLAYYEICTILKETGVTTGTISGSKSPYMIENGRWTGYEDVASVSEKVDYAIAQGFGGIMLYTVDLDDFNDVCGSGKNPLLAAAISRIPVVG